MLDPKELRYISASRKAEIEVKEKEDLRKREKSFQKKISEYIKRIEEEMKKAANNGEFSAEVEVSGEDEVKRRLENHFFNFSVRWFGDGYTKDYIILSW